MRKLSYILVSILILLTFSCSKKDAQTKAYEEKYASLGDGIYAVIITDKGDIVTQLEYEKTPLTVANFVGLAQGTKKNNVASKGKPYFDGLTFHRVEPDFVIQGGDPAGNGTGGPGYKFPDEFDLDLTHSEAGILSMANSGPNTNGSQFFITLAATPHLDGKHAVFGHVVEGIDVVKSITAGDKIVRVIILRNGEKAKAWTATDEDFKKFKNSAFDRKISYIKAKEKREIAELDKIFPNAITTPNGLKYIQVKKGWGGKPNRGDTIKVHYTGKLLNGQIFDSSIQRNEPFEFRVGLGQVIQGWDEAFLDMTKGEKRTLIIPPNLAYGSQGQGPIPANSWLVFEVEYLQ